MGKFVSIFIVLILVSIDALAQDPVRIKLNGKVSAEISDLEGIYIINLKTEEATITEKGGYFSILANVGDTLMFSAVQFKGIRIELTQTHFEKMFFVKMEPMMNQLREVIVRRYDNINAVALGIIPKGQKSYTPAERKYATASSAKMNPMGLDPMLNYFSGRSAMLKKEREVEKKEFYLKQLEDMFDTNHFVNILKIPSEYVKGFEYYIVENMQFVAILKSKNKTMTAFLMGELAVKYNEIIDRESK